MNNRFRRLRNSPGLRNLVRETVLTKYDLIQPYFIVEGKNKKETIASMPEIYRYSVDLLLKEIEKFIKTGGQAGILFGVPAKKDKLGSEAYSSSGIVQKAVKAIKENFPDFVVITDVCLCGYTDHGHCGVVEKGKVNNDKTIDLLGKVAVSHAEAGADLVAPSDMMDFRVGRIREELDKKGFAELPIMSYAVKYSSAFYGPFREAAHSAPGFGDRKTYQMDPANQREAIKEAEQDVKEGADIIMVKPAVAYLDIISLLRQKFNVPIAAYHVSGEYAMIKAAARNKWIDERNTVLETLTSIKRAGADIIVTYYAKEALGWIKN